MDNGRSPIHSRREPTLVEANGRVITIRPLPWRKRNDLGQLIVGEYSRAVQTYIDLTKEDKNKALQADFFDGIIDWDKILALGVPGEETDDLTWEEMIQVGVEMLKVNGLEAQEWMINPKLRDHLINTSMNSESQTTENGAKTTSSEDSGSTDTVENPSTTSPTMN